MQYFNEIVKDNLKKIQNKGENVANILKRELLIVSLI